METKKSVIAQYPPFSRPIKLSKGVILEFRCKKCRKIFFETVDEEECKYVLNNKSFLNSRTCNKCRYKQVRKILKVPHKK